MKKRQKLIIGGVIVSGFVAAIVFTVVQLSGAVEEIMDATSSKTPDAILASAGIAEGMNVSLPVSYFDQRADECVSMYDIDDADGLRERQFEWSECGYFRRQLEEGLVNKKLDDAYLPIAMRGELTPNKKADLTRWFSEVEGKSKAYSGILKLKYSSENSEFVFADDDFYPLDEISFSDGDYVNKDGHNHLFTMSFAVPFTALLSGEEEIEISSDDDTFIFIGRDLVVDLGGIHDTETRTLQIDEQGDVYVRDMDGVAVSSGVNVANNRNSILRIFHADRDSFNSVFKIKFSKMDIGVTDTNFANSGEEEGVQIAYDPSDLAFTAPLGESLVLQPDNTSGKITVAIILGGIVLVLAVLLTSAIHFIFRIQG